MASSFLNFTVNNEYELSNDLGLLVNNEEFSDFIVRVDGKVFNVHKAILSGKIHGISDLDDDLNLFQLGVQFSRKCSTPSLGRKESTKWP
jgi:hypothetical protein